ncbi:MAG TPA: uroporphyrinogen-III C-methyltransferase [Alphaproteobacteria bacterium]|nr:uroporphyrinogen-III C-methyltransferase [Alphaproteobacteria bacterium]
MTDTRLQAALGAFPLPEFRPGEVWLAGGGPGDPGLLTLHAVNALTQADIILYDALVHDGVLALARPEAVREFAGKRGGRPSAQQRDITERLIELARQNKRVLRLKGGDPFVFGRGGEEALGLVAAGISFRVIPGVTAGLGGLAYAHIPATTRDTNHGVILVTGQYAAGNERNLDWAAVAATKLPVILYMGMSRLPEISASLLEGGMPADTPVAIVNSATTPQQRVFISTLDRVATDAAAQGFGAPSIIAIGEMVRLREALSPFAVSLT